jgi:hypothetical protein
MDASMTLKFSIPRTFPSWSTTAIGSEDGPILQVQLMWEYVVDDQANRKLRCRKTEKA